MKERQRKIAKYIFLTVYYTIAAILLTWIIASWVNVFTNNCMPGMAVNIWDWNFFIVLFG